jgi:hypothetical protein
MGFGSPLCALILLAIWIGMPVDSAAEKIRRPVWAGQFYPADGSQLKAQIEALTQKARAAAPAPPVGRPLRALVLPHAGYAYSGWTAAHGALMLAGRRFAKVVLIGPDHRVGFANAAVSDATAWQTPLGLVPVHGDAQRLVETDKRFEVIGRSDAAEHSLEVILPLLQYHLERFDLVPLTMGPADPAAMARAIEPLLDDQTLLVISSDLSHFLAYDQAAERDKQTIQAVLDLNPSLLQKPDNRACGAVPLLMAIALARQRGWLPQLCHYANSGDTAGGKDKVVGYAAIAFWGDATMNADADTLTVDATRGKALVKLARRTLAEAFGLPQPPDKELEAALQDERLQRRQGTFVTLTQKGSLRGCIGSLSAAETIVEGVKRNARNAAFHDPRFAPLSATELDHTAIEVSILTDPQPLPYQGAADLAAKLRPKIDGVILRKGGAGATFLPQVWDQLPRAEDFLAHLCRKAGLSADAWQQGDLTVLTYQVQYFHE